MFSPISAARVSSTSVVLVLAIKLPHIDKER
jgi:hypothetical protein